MNNQKELEKILEKVMQEECEFKPSGDLQADCERWELQGGATSIERLVKALAEAILDKARLDEEKIYLVLKHFPYSYGMADGNVKKVAKALSSHTRSIIKWN